MFQPTFISLGSLCPLGEVYVGWAIDFIFLPSFTVVWMRATVLFTQCGVERMRHFFGGERETLCVANCSRFLFYSEHRIETERGGNRSNGMCCLGTWLGCSEIII